jgi:hypothetical protein
MGTALVAAVFLLRSRGPGYLGRMDSIDYEAEVHSYPCFLDRTAGIVMQLSPLLPEAALSRHSDLAIDWNLLTSTSKMRMRMKYLSLAHIFIFVVFG